MHTEAGQRYSTAVEEDMLFRSTVADERDQLRDRPGPQGAPSPLVALTPDEDGREVSFRHARRFEIADQP